MKKSLNIIQSCVCVWVTLSGIPFPVAIVKLEKLFDS